ncbi:MAG TPA: hypothetical protein VGY98_08130, partial [Verrucomicrobiae bacterium]|nr:hypothetical protein [Verrucomicrobiae bacterium]
PPFLRDLIAAPPRAGSGVHHWLFRVARQLHAHLPAGDIVKLLQDRVAHCGRHVPRAEIVSAVQSSIACAWHPKSGPASAPAPAPGKSKWPKLNLQRRQQIVSKGPGLVGLWDLSSPAVVDNARHTERIIDRFFPGNPLLCCGKSSREFDTRPREQWRGQLSRLQFIVPSPMSSVNGMTKDGRPSRHTLANTGPRRFLVCEFDTGTGDDHAALLLHLGAFAPLVCAVHSGGKSLHGWFYVQGQPEAKVERFFRYAVSLGADPATWTRSQFVRMPDGLRDNGPDSKCRWRRQTVFFLNYKQLEQNQ